MLTVYISGVIAFYILIAINLNITKELRYFRVLLCCLGWPLIILIAIGMDIRESFIMPFVWINGLANKFRGRNNE